ncbi:hypothetical protein [Streptomyces sp. DH-12]|uniref:hypothetical protein n=1 Tax=Streptomyces sp. DH-12 TaxID=2072509 RepID=UPI001057309C|nr:hypothetical protein [Streptomyces sp. DH-12]
MDTGDWIAFAAVVISVAAAGIAIWQARTASQSAAHAKQQAQAADEQVRLAREQLQQGERSHREQVELSERIHREQNEPYVVVDIAPEGPGSTLLLLTIDNAGPTLARDVTVAFDPPLSSTISGQAARIHSVLSRPIPVLPPGRRLTYVFDMSASRFNSGFPMEFEVTVNATGPAGAVEPLVYRIDLGVLAAARVGEHPYRRIEERLGKIASDLRSLAKAYGEANRPAIRAALEESIAAARRRDTNGTTPPSAT